PPSHVSLAPSSPLFRSQYGLNLTEFGVLELLYHKGPQPIQVIGKKVLLASSSITYVIDKLEEKELIVRESCPRDRRVIHVRLTEDRKSTRLNSSHVKSS